MAIWKMHEDTFRKYGAGPLELRLSDRADALVINVQLDGTFVLDDLAAIRLPLHACAHVLPNNEP